MKVVSSTSLLAFAHRMNLVMDAGEGVRRDMHDTSYNLLLLLTESFNCINLGHVQDCHFPTLQC